LQITRSDHIATLSRKRACKDELGGVGKRIDPARPQVKRKNGKPAPREKQTERSAVAEVGIEEVVFVKVEQDGTAAQHATLNDPVGRLGITGAL